MTPGELFMAGCTVAAMVVGGWVGRPSRPNPRDPRQVRQAREEYALALALVILLAVLSTTAMAQEMAR